MKLREVMMAQRPITMVEGSAITALQKKDLLNRLARVEGQLRGVQRLIGLAEVPSDIDAVAQQMAAARKALDRAFVQLLSGAIVTQGGNASDLEQAQRSAAHLAALLEKYA
jgi:DNA-binding FrmR family transcriptional regulator